MHIKLTQTVAVSPSDVMTAAKAWFQAEGVGDHVVHGTTPEGNPSVAAELLQDGILITTRFIAISQSSDTRVDFSLRMQGTSLGSKFRSLSLLPTRRLVRRAAAKQFQQITEQLDTVNHLSR